MNRARDSQALKASGHMVGNMVGTSLAMAPAFLLAQLCDVVDLDGPLALARDRMPGVAYEDGRIWRPESVWGAAADASRRINRSNTALAKDDAAE
jgi:L-Ala-D/L-Glu epimerase